MLCHAIEKRTAQTNKHRRVTAVVVCLSSGALRSYIPWQAAEGQQKKLHHLSAALLPVEIWVRQEEAMQGSAAQHWLIPLRLSEMQSPAGQHRQRR